MKRLIFFFSIVLYSSSILAQKSNTYEVYAIEFARDDKFVPAKDFAINPIINDSARFVFMTWLLKWLSFAPARYRVIWYILICVDVMEKS